MKNIFNEKKYSFKKKHKNPGVVVFFDFFGGGKGEWKTLGKNGLRAAGAATTARQRQEFQTLPAGKISPVRQNGKTFYVYPDAPHNQIYVGNKAQRQMYKRLKAQQPNSSGPIVFEDHTAGGNVTVKEFYGWAPLGVLRVKSTTTHHQQSLFGIAVAATGDSTANHTSRIEFAENLKAGRTGNQRRPERADNDLTLRRSQVLTHKKGNVINMTSIAKPQSYTP